MGWSLIVLRSMKVKKKNGTYAMVSPGDEISDAQGFAELPNPGVWIKRGYFKVKDASSAPPYRGRYEPPRALTKKDIAAKEKRRAAIENGEEPPSTDFIPAEQTTIGPGTDAKGDPVPSAAIDFVKEKPEEAPAQEPLTEDQKVSAAELMAHTLTQLQELAEQLKLKVKKKAGKKEIVEAILALQA